MPSRYYLPLRHDAIAKYVYEQHCMKLVPGWKIEYPADELFTLKVMLSTSRICQ